jgi:hypothetical protein
MRFALITAIFLVSTVGQPNAQTASNSMACAAAIAYYERNGKIYTIGNGRDVVPIYDAVPASQRNSYSCQPGYRLTPRTLATADNRRCTIGYKCTPYVFYSR